MNKAFLYKIFVLVCLIQYSYAQHISPLGVRHVIECADLNQSRMWLIQARSGYLVVNPSDKHKKKSKEFTQLCVRIRNGVVHINDTLLDGKQLFLYGDGGVSINGVLYCGALSIVVPGKQVQIMHYAQQPVQLKDAALLSGWWQKEASTAIAAQQKNTPKKNKVVPAKNKVRTAVAAHDAAITRLPMVNEETRKARIVRVLLDEKTGAGTHWQLTAGELIVADVRTGKQIAQGVGSISIASKNGYIYLNNKKYVQHELLIMARSGRISCLDAEYEGSFLIIKKNGVYMLINCLDLEDYLCSVVCFECWPGWPLEMHKVQAVVSRSYVISMVLKAHKSKKPYHVKNTNVHQKYGGFHTDDELKRAVQETKGIFLTHQEQPIIAMFDSCCGGIVPAHMHGPDFISAPYLAREYACTHCSDCKVFNWQAEYEVNDFIKKFKKVAPHLNSCHGVHIAERDKAGLVKKASIKGKKGRVTVTGKQIYSALKDVKSFHFDVTHTDDTILFTGTGYGHHLGLCQWGAREMVRKGFDYTSILKFYYPGISFMRLY